MKTDDLDLMYRDVILDHYKNPRGKKQLIEADANSTGYNPVCGDKVEISINFEANRIQDIAVNSSGCAISVASGSMLAEMLQGMTIDEARKLTAVFKLMMNGEEIPEEIDLGDLDTLEGVQKFPIRIKCALIAWQTLDNILHQREESPVLEKLDLQQEGYK